MKGFELSERFFREIGLPTIEQRLPGCVLRLAVGVSGGSQAAQERRCGVSRSRLGAEIHGVVCQRRFR